MTGIPSRMRCIEIIKPGAPDVLVLAERPVPQAKVGEVLIQVHTAGVNRPDVLQRGYLPCQRAPRTFPAWKSPEQSWLAAKAFKARAWEMLFAR